ncbi:MAG TPA: hypothetical protein VHG93_16195 [Longimicrobium sp.]|nr:hypothetical protein [Longimicrobium sp.]
MKAARRAVLLAPLLAAGCIDFLPLSGPGAPGKASFHLALDSRNSGPGGAADTLQVSGLALAGGAAEGRDTLRVAGHAIQPARRDGEEWGYGAILVLAPGALAQPVEVALPVPPGVPMPLSRFTVLNTTRAGPDTLSLHAGADLVLPVEPGGAGALPGPWTGSWDLLIARGAATTAVRSTAPPPERIVVPASLLPHDTASVMQVVLRSYRQSHVDDGDSQLTVALTAELRWRVRILIEDPGAH